MHTISGLAIIALAIPAALPAQTGEFVVRLGRDTLAVERYTRTADRLEGEQVVRSPRTVHRLYTATFGRGVSAAPTVSREPFGTRTSQVLPGGVTPRIRTGLSERRV